MKLSKDAAVFNFFGYLIIIGACIFCLFPLILIVSASFTDDLSLTKYGYHLLPVKFSTAAYRTIFEFPDKLIRAYSNTIAITIIGTLIGLICITMTSYVIMRKDFKYRNIVAFIIYFTTIFGGGMVPWYVLLSKYLHLTNNYIARVFPVLMSPFLIILMRTFMQASVPAELMESAKIDGAGDFKIYTHMVLPIITPGLATVGLFLALGYWNEWYLTSLFISKQSMYSLQFFLYDILNSINFAQEMAAITGQIPENLPTETLKMAMVVVVVGPIIFLYPFVQRYFVAGITIGAVKG
ncbi:sugar ABC transporter permease [Spirochaetia bacterium]|nr:sugar ABC transporter permease [Spirochaetia bacterium]